MELVIIRFGYSEIIGIDVCLRGWRRWLCLVGRFVGVFGLFRDFVGLGYWWNRYWIEFGEISD